MANTEQRKTTKEILLGAAQVIRERGLCKGVFEDDKGCLCTWGAINVANGLHANGWTPIGDSIERGAKRYAEAFDALETLREFLGGKEVGVVDWSDAPERTPEEVITTLEKAAEVLA
jgi:hypothetical protein